MLSSESAPGSVSTSVAVAVRRLRSEEEQRSGNGRSFLSRILGFITYLVWVALGVIVVLVLMDPRELQPLESASISDAPAMVDRLIASSRYAPAVVSQQMINACLRSSAHSAWNSPVTFLPAPEWTGARVFLGHEAVAYTFVLTMFGYSIHFSETFHLAGSSGNWNLVGDSGSIGLLPIKAPFLPILTFLASASASPQEQILAILKEAPTLEIRYGNVVFTTH